MTVAECCESVGRAMGDAVFRFISRGSLVAFMVVMVITNIILTAVLGDQLGGRNKELEVNTYTSCEVQTIKIMLKPKMQNLTDTIGSEPCYYNNKHPSDVMLGMYPEVSSVAIAFCVMMWIMTLVFSMALLYGRD